MRNIRIVSILMIATIMIGCNKTPEDKMAENIAAYFMKDNSNVPPVSEGISVYVDNSDGLYYAYSANNDNVEILKSITNRLTSSAEWFSLSNDTIEKLNFPTTDIYNKVTDKNWYKHQVAPIEKTLKKILNEGHDALLITDFEEYKKSADGKYIVCKENFAKEYFTEWLQRGNSIDFIITDYNENKVQKHLYFIMFNTPEKLLKTEIDNALKDRGYRYHTFSLTTDFYSITNEYPAADKAGIYYDADGNDIVCAMQDKYVNGLRTNNVCYEFLPFGCTWDDMHKNSKALQEAGVPVPFTDFFRKLFIDLSKDDVYKVNKLDVKVTNITADYTSFLTCIEASKHKPTMKKDANGNNIADFSADPQSEQYYNKDGSIKSDYIYKPKETSALSEVFELNQELFNNGIKNNKNKVEIGVSWHKNFTIPNEAKTGLIRVDIIIEECTPCFSDLDSYFSWTDSKGGRNTNLSEAIRNTLDKVNPEGKIIYTYFIRSGECTLQ